MLENTMPDGFEGRQPFYMTYPFSDRLFSEGEEERDMEALVSLYPEDARRIWPEVADACDRLEYDGSLMFDEYPDRFLVRREAMRIQERVEKECCKRDRRDLRDLIEILFFQEMHRRRTRRRRFKRHFIEGIE